MKFCFTLRIVSDMPYKIKPGIKCHTQNAKYFVELKMLFLLL